MYNLKFSQTPLLIVDSQLVPSKILNRKIILGAMAIALIFVLTFTWIYLNRISDPYIQEVFALQGDNVKGKAIFEINCAGCHGLEAHGDVGPSLTQISRRKSKIQIIEQVISGKTPPMPKFQPKTQEMADLLIYLQKL